MPKPRLREIYLPANRLQFFLRSSIIPLLTSLKYFALADSDAWLHQQCYQCVPGPFNNYCNDFWWASSDKVTCNSGYCLKAEYVSSYKSYIVRLCVPHTANFVNFQSEGCRSDIKLLPEVENIIRTVTSPALIQPTELKPFRSSEHRRYNEERPLIDALYVCRCENHLCNASGTLPRFNRILLTILLSISTYCFITDIFKHLM